MLKLKRSRWVSWLALGVFCAQAVTVPLAQADSWVTVVPQTSVQKLAK